MPSNLPRNTGNPQRGGLEPTIKPDQFPSDIDTIRKVIQPETIIFENSGAATSRPFCIAPCEYWSVYVFGTTPDVDIEVCMNPKYEKWAVLNTNALVNETVYGGVGGQYPWIRIVINSGTGVDVHLFRKYATY